MSTITEIKVSFEQESNPAALDRLALQQIDIFEGLLKEGRTDDARAAGLHLDAIEKRRAELGELETVRRRVAESKNRLAQPATPHQHAAPVDTVPEGGRQWKDMGKAFTGMADYQAARKSGMFTSEMIRVPDMAVRLDQSILNLKTLVLGNSASSAGSIVLNDFLPGIVDMLQRPRTFLDLLTRVRTSSDTIDWVKQTGFTNSAATVAEATSTTGISGTKPESALDWVRTSLPVQTVATWIPVTTRALADAPMMEDIINGQIRVMLELALEAQVLTGGGTGSDLTGIINQGILTQALGSDNTMDAILKASVKIQISGQMAPTDIVMYPTNFQFVRLLRENASTATLGQYLMGPPSQVGPMTLWGLPITLSQGLAAGTTIVGAFNPATHALFDREQTTVRTGYIDQMFVRNMVAILGELRAAFIVTRPLAFCSITGLS